MGVGREIERPSQQDKSEVKFYKDGQKGRPWDALATEVSSHNLGPTFFTSRYKDSGFHKWNFCHPKMEIFLATPSQADGIDCFDQPMKRFARMFL